MSDLVKSIKDQKMSDLVKSIKEMNDFYKENFSKKTTCIKCGSELRDCGRSDTGGVPLQFQVCDKCGMYTVWYLSDKATSVKIECI